VPALINRILPAAVHAVETTTDRPEEDLFPEEAALVRRAVTRRRAEFAAVRWCARSALAQLGVPPVAILRGERGAPAWPHGVVGSMTHCDGYRAAAVARSEDVLALGIDAEPADRLPDGVLSLIASDAERAHLAALAIRDAGIPWDRLLFCAKEAVYKAWFPATGLWLGFQQAEVRIRTNGDFTVRLLVPGPPAWGARLMGIPGRWLSAGGLILTAMVLPSRLPAPLAARRRPARSHDDGRLRREVARGLGECNRAGCLMSGT
jgi:4'-phosphopantetheinyl transferase EntD